MSLLLRIQIKALSFKSKELWREESLAQLHAHYGNAEAGEVREILHNLRTCKLRKESRSAHLAYGFLKGRPYWRMELTCHEAPDFERVERIALNYAWEDPRIIKQRFAEWLGNARQHLVDNPPMSTFEGQQMRNLAKVSGQNLTETKQPFHESIDVIFVDVSGLLSGIFSEYSGNEVQLERLNSRV